MEETRAAVVEDKIVDKKTFKSLLSGPHRNTEKRFALQAEEALATKSRRRKEKQKGNKLIAQCRCMGHFGIGMFTYLFSLTSGQGTEV
jgi:hypothetical protein